MRDYVIADNLLFSGEPPHVLLVAAATLGFKRRNPSRGELVKATGLNNHTVTDAQRKLDGLFLYDRPQHFYDRQPDNPRFNRSNRVIRVRPDVDPDRENYTILPRAVVAILPRGRRKNVAVTRVVALFYAREQLVRGAIQVEDDAVARKLGLWETRNGYHEGPAVKQVARARNALLEAGVLVVHNSDARPCPVYTIPGATPQRPENPDDLEPEWTKRFHRVTFGGEALDT